ncbi:MAG: hypothetical protein WC129_04990 [Sphaerochaetaceae bacterium]|jgi:hypothetical protein|nr:hypothetical protein [Sphaerochaetaceae bacterium]MDX9810381.1 hypothetical protein [Sphaerochaetaceae bacterium]NLV84940.1 hypothetical protein [Spirochaetales bacterium]
MLKARRVLAFSVRIQSYLLLLYLFFIGLYVVGLRYPIIDTYMTLLYDSLVLFTWIQIGYSAVLVLITCGVWIRDKVFPAREFISILVKVLVVVIIVYALGYIESVIHYGFTVRF